MADPKTLKFQFVVDEASLQKTRQVIRELTADLTKLNEAAGKFGGGAGLGGGGGAGIGGGVNVFGGGAKSPEAQRVIAKTPPVGRQLVQGFLDQKQIFKGIADGSKDSMRVMTDSLRQAIGFQKRELRDLDNAAKHLAETYDELTAKIDKFKSGKGSNWQQQARNLEEKRNAIGLEHQQVVQEQQKAKGDLAQLEGMDPNQVAGKSPLFGKGGRLWNTQKGVLANLGLNGMGQLAGLAGLRGMMGVGGLIAAANWGINESLAGYNGMGALGAARNQVVQPMYQGMMSGDVKSIIALHRMQGDERQDLRDSATSIAAMLDRGRGALGNAVGSVVGKGNGTGMGGGFTSAAQGTAQLKQAFGNLNATTAAMDVRDQYAIDQYDSGVMGRIGTNRILGTGLGTGDLIKDKNGRVIGRQMQGDTYGRLQSRLLEHGYTPEQLAGATASMRNLGGYAGGRAFGGAEMAASAAGFGGFGALGVAGMRAGGGRSMAYGSIYGGIDPFAGIQLGQAIIGNGFDPMGTTSGLGVLSAAQRSGLFTHGINDFNAVQRVAGGMAMGSNITTGGLDAFQKGRNLVSAIDILGPGASTYAQDYLGNGMNLRQMMDIAGGGKLTATAHALGITQGQVKSQLGNSLESVINDRFVDENSNDPLSKTIRAYQASGKSLSEYLGGLKGSKRIEAVSNLGAYYGLTTGQGEEAGIGLAGLEAGMSGSSIHKLLKGKGLGGGVGGDVDKTALKSMADQAKDVADRLTGIAGELKSAWGQRNTIQNFVGGMSDLSKNVTDFVNALSTLTGAVNDAAARLSGKTPFVPPKRVGAPLGPTFQQQLAKKHMDG